MSCKEALIRHRNIIYLLQNNQPTFSEIAEYLKNKSALEGYDLAISKRTFDRDREDIYTLYNIDIKYDTKIKAYLIQDAMDQVKGDKLIDAFDTLHLMSLADNISSFVDLEKIRPKGTDHIYGLIHAVKCKKQIEFIYRLYGSSEINNLSVEPYFLKEYRNRWYLVGKNLETKEVETFGLDRMAELEIKKASFIRPATDELNKIYNFSFGIYPSPPKIEPKEVILSFTREKGVYIKNLPLHRTQQVLVDDEKEFRIQLTVHTTYDFVMELLSHGRHVKVLQPKSLIDILKADYKRSLALYGA